MEFSRHLFLIATSAALISVAHGQPLVPMLCIFGDSVADVGNNNNLYTLIKSNFPPYGRDFVTHNPTGRFCNGKLATDFTGIRMHTTSYILTKNTFWHFILTFIYLFIFVLTAENLGFTSYPPAYLSQEANGKNLLTGANFASAGSGYYDRTAQLYVQNK